MSNFAAFRNWGEPICTEIEEKWEPRRSMVFLVAGSDDA